ncbi:hypothetical protein MSAN_02135400 [Mycena sanguinolenta]|uniref:Uncharacterized protein n=1 Tax=Mycena sanguinolenta TaxID=230812 RepID=A0A8H6XFR9_9AGAR|nr:hypothetical protein MSAN_02135400 [Mycena sanguinolenta]
MAREDRGEVDDEEFEIEGVPPKMSRRSTTATATTSNTEPALHGRAKKNQQKRQRERAKRAAGVVESFSSITPPAPTPRALEKAATSVPLPVNYSATEFRTTQQRWTGLTTPHPHPLLAHANDPEYLKQHMQYFDWPGDKCHVIVDRKGHNVGVLISPPEPGAQWAETAEAAAAAFRRARDQMTFPAGAFQHRRASGEGFPTAAAGFAFGTGRKGVGNIRASSATNAAAMDELLAEPSVGRMATYPICKSPLSPPTSSLIAASRDASHLLPDLRRVPPCQASSP